MMEFIKFVIWGIVIFLLIIIVIWIFSLFGVITVNAESAYHIRDITVMI